MASSSPVFLIATIVLLGILSVAFFSSPLHWISQTIVLAQLNGPSKNSLQELLQTVPEGRLRLSKLEKTSVLGLISMWMAFPAADSPLPGTAWYEDLWNNHNINGFQVIDQMISLSPCRNQDKTFVQIGAHLGIFPMVAAYRGCRAIAVEPIVELTHYIKISARLQNWNEDRFLVINAVGSDRSNGSILFDTSQIAIAHNTAETGGKIQVPLTTLDEINKQHCKKRTAGASPITYAVIDVEGHEQEVLLGAKQLIREQTVLAFEIEVWTRQLIKGNITKFPGLELLAKNNYRLYSLSGNPLLNFPSCGDVTHRIEDLPTILGHRCEVDKLDSRMCLGEILAVRGDLPSPKLWYSGCGL